ENLWKKVKKRRKKKFKKRDAKVDMKNTTDKKPNKWKPLPYEEDNSNVPLVWRDWGYMEIIKKNAKLQVS
ncbi:hypothetical protein INT47_004415, partial [Mucor saturninus]